MLRLNGLVALLVVVVVVVLVAGVSAYSSFEKKYRGSVERYRYGGYGDSDEIARYYYGDDDNVRYIFYNR